MHNSCTIKVKIDDVEMKKGGGECGELPIGARVKVYYDPSDPAIYSSSDPWDEYKNELVFSSLALIVMPLLGAAIVYRRCA